MEGFPSSLKFLPGLDLGGRVIFLYRIYILFFLFFLGGGRGRGFRAT